MKNGILVGFLALMVIINLFLFLDKEPKSPELIKAETERVLEQRKLKEAEVEASHRRAIEAQQAKAEIQRNKPVEVQVSETHMSTGEAVVTATAVAGGVYIFSKVLESF